MNPVEINEEIFESKINRYLTINF